MRNTTSRDWSGFYAIRGLTRFSGTGLGDDLEGPHHVVGLMLEDVAMIKIFAGV